MLLIKRRAGDMVRNSDPKRQLGEQVQDVFLRRDGLDGDADLPASYRGNGISENQLPGLGRTGREDGAGAGIPPERVRRRVGQELPDPLDWCIHGVNRTGTKAHGRDYTRVKARKGRWRDKLIRNNRAGKEQEEEIHEDGNIVFFLFRFTKGRILKIQAEGWCASSKYLRALKVSGWPLSNRCCRESKGSRWVSTEKLGTSQGTAFK
jgi:hypothetical protein